MNSDCAHERIYVIKSCAAPTNRFRPKMIHGCRKQSKKLVRVLKYWEPFGLQIDWVNHSDPHGTCDFTIGLSLKRVDLHSVPNPLPYPGQIREPGPVALLIIASLQGPDRSCLAYLTYPWGVISYIILVTPKYQVNMEVWWSSAYSWGIIHTRMTFCHQTKQNEGYIIHCGAVFKMATTCSKIHATLGCGMTVGNTIV